MSDNFDQALEVDVLAAALSIDRQESGDLLQLLSRKLKNSLPRNTQIKRHWWGLGAVKSITVCFDDVHYQISRERYGSITARVIKVIRGVSIKTSEISTAEWSQAVAETLAQMAARNAEIRNALSQFVLG